MCKVILLQKCIQIFPGWAPTGTKACHSLLEETKKGRGNQIWRRTIQKEETAFVLLLWTLHCKPSRWDVGVACFHTGLSKHLIFWGSLETRSRGRRGLTYSQWKQEGKSSNTKGGFIYMGCEEQKERKWRKPKVSRQASPSQSVQSVQLADLVTSASRGGGGIEGGRRGGERKRRSRRGSRVDRRVAVSGIGTLGGSWRGRRLLNHLRQGSVRPRQSVEKDKGRGWGTTRGRTVRGDYLTPKRLWREAGKAKCFFPPFFANFQN